MPKGILDRSLRNPLNYSREDYQQAKRAKQDPKLMKAAIQDCWKRSDNAETFKAALEEKGFFLSQGGMPASLMI